MKTCLEMAVLFAVVFGISGCDSEKNQLQGNLDNSLRKSKQMADDWKFSAPENLAVITLTRIIDGSNHILYVCHDEDGDWQFLDGGSVTESDAATVALHEIVELDSTLADLADLPAGWIAERETLNAGWIRRER